MKLKFHYIDLFIVFFFSLKLYPQLLSQIYTDSIDESQIFDSPIKISLKFMTFLEEKLLLWSIKTPGRYSTNFDASKLASGVYIYQIRANDYVSSKKMMLVK